MHAAFVLIVFILFLSGAAIGYLLPIDDAVDMRYIELHGLTAEQEWESYRIERNALDLETISKEKQKARESARKQDTLRMAMAREQGLRIEIINP